MKAVDNSYKGGSYDGDGSFPYQLLRYLGAAIIFVGLVVMLAGVADVVYTIILYQLDECSPAADWIGEYPCQHEKLMWTWIASGIWVGLIAIIVGGFGAVISQSRPNIRQDRDSFAIAAGLLAFLFAPALIVLAALEAFYQDGIFYAMVDNEGLETNDEVKLLLPILLAIGGFILWILALVAVVAACCCAPLSEEDYPLQFIPPGYCPLPFHLPRPQISYVAPPFFPNPSQPLGSPYFTFPLPLGTTSRPPILPSIQPQEVQWVESPSDARPLEAQRGGQNQGMETQHNPIYMPNNCGYMDHQMGCSPSQPEPQHNPIYVPNSCGYADQQMGCYPMPYQLDTPQHNPVYVPNNCGYMDPQMGCSPVCIPSQLEPTHLVPYTLETPHLTPVPLDPPSPPGLYDTDRRRWTMEPLINPSSDPYPARLRRYRTCSSKPFRSQLVEVREYEDEDDDNACRVYSVNKLPRLSRKGRSRKSRSRKY